MSTDPLSDPLNLRDLPTATAPETLWPAIASRLRDDDRRPRPPWLLPLGLAATLILAVVCARLIEFTPHEQPAASGSMSELQLARAASARLEQLLRHQRHGLLDASSVETLAWMENELGWLDMQLTNNPTDIELWQQRVELLQQMTRNYERNNWQAGIRLASY
ncbi:MAG: hypothetical protein WD397_04860 [Wenzhouxiangellaceae bacterium]